MSDSNAAAKQLIEEAVTARIRPQWKKIERIMLDGDVAIVLHEPDLSNESMSKILRWVDASRGDIQQLTRTRAMRVFSEVEPKMRAWITSRVPAGQARIFLLTRNAYFLLNHTDARSFWIEPGTLIQA